MITKSTGEPKKADDKKPLPADRVYARAVCHYEPDTDADAHELPFKKNDVLIVHQQDESGWWKAELSGAFGWIPSDYVEIMASEEVAAAKQCHICSKVLTPKREFTCSQCHKTVCGTDSAKLKSKVLGWTEAQIVCHQPCLPELKAKWLEQQKTESKKVDANKTAPTPAPAASTGQAAPATKEPEPTPEPTVKGLSLTSFLWPFFLLKVGQ